MKKTHNYLWLFDAGHGGVINGVAQTAGKRSKKWSKGILYEGVSNRDIRDRVSKKCIENGYNVMYVNKGDKDISLGNRVKKVNSIYEKAKNCILISFHSDAFELEKANGWSCYSSRGETKSDKIATIMYGFAKEAGFKLRVDFSDGDIDKEANFTVIKKTNCPAVLVENFFMTNKKDYLFLMSEKGKEKISNVIFKTIKYIEENGL